MTIKVLKISDINYRRVYGWGEEGKECEMNESPDE